MILDGVFIGHPHISWEHPWFPVDCRLNQSSDGSVYGDLMMLRRHTMRYHKGEYHGKLGYLQAFSALCIDVWSSWVWNLASRCQEARKLRCRSLGPYAVHSVL